MSYNRVNLDGKSITENRPAAVAMLPGTFVLISAGKFEEAPAGTMGRCYVVNPAYHQGMKITDEIPQGATVVADYVESGRELACLVDAGTYSKDQPMTVGANGKLVGGDTNIIGFCQDDVVLADAGFIRVRFTAAPASATITGVVITGDDEVTQGSTFTYSAAVLPAAADQSGIKWAIDTDSSSTGSSIDQNTGVFTAGSNNEGEVIIKATASDNVTSDTFAVSVVS